MEAILDSSFEEFHKLAAKEVETQTYYKHKEDDSYDDDSDDGLEALQKEIHQIHITYEEEDGKNKHPAKQQQTKQYNNNKTPANKINLILAAMDNKQ